jgi:hypothetical protein
MKLNISETLVVKAIDYEITLGGKIICSKYLK